MQKKVCANQMQKFEKAFYLGKLKHKTLLKLER